MCLTLLVLMSANTAEVLSKLEFPQTRLVQVLVISHASCIGFGYTKLLYDTPQPLQSPKAKTSVHPKRPSSMNYLIKLEPQSPAPPSYQHILSGRVCINT